LSDNVTSPARNLIVVDAFYNDRWNAPATMATVTMLIITYLSSAAAADSELPSCTPSCKEGTICLRIEANKPAACKAIPDIAPLKDLGLPFSAKETVYCVHSSGAAGHRHLHWSVQKLPGKTQKEWEDRIAWDGER